MHSHMGVPQRTASSWHPRSPCPGRPHKTTRVKGQNCLTWVLLLGRLVLGDPPVVANNGTRVIVLQIKRQPAAAYVEGPEPACHDGTHSRSQLSGEAAAAHGPPCLPSAPASTARPQRRCPARGSAVVGMRLARLPAAQGSGGGSGGEAGQPFCPRDQRIIFYV